MVRVFEAGAALQDRRLRQVGPQLIGIAKGPAIVPLAAVDAVADDPRAVRQQLQDRHLGQLRMQAVDMAASPVVKRQAAFLAQLHDAGGGEGLRMRGNAEAMARRQCRALRRIVMAEGCFEHHLAALGDGDGNAGQLEATPLEVDPLRDVVERRLQPFLHGRGPRLCSYWRSRRSASIRLVMSPRLRCKTMAYSDRFIAARLWPFETMSTMLKPPAAPRTSQSMLSTEPSC